MANDFQMELQELGLLPAEAQVYLALVRNGALGGSAIARVTGFPRSSVYLTLNSLLDKGLVENGAGNGSRFLVVPPDTALPSLIIQEKEAIAQRENLAAQVGRRLSSIAAPIEAARGELIQVIRSPRRFTERFEQLQLEAKRDIEVFIKAPFFIGSGNPAQEKARRRGVRVRGLYERGILDVPEVRPYLMKWLSDGEEARIYDGELPHKLAIFDRESLLLHLAMPGEQMRMLFVRHVELAASLGMLFDSLWEHAEPLVPERRKQLSSVAKDLGKKARERDGSGKGLVATSIRNGRARRKQDRRGFINRADISLVKSKSGKAIP